MVQSTALVVAVAQASVGCRLQREEDLELDQKVSLVSPGTNGTGEMTQKVLKIDCKRTWNTREHQRNVRNRPKPNKTGLEGHTEAVSPLRTSWRGEESRGIGGSLVKGQNVT